MADENHVNLILKGVQDWNARRNDEPFTPDLSGFSVSDIKLKPLIRLPQDDGEAFVDLRDANFSNANFRDCGFFSLPYPDEDRGEDIGVHFSFQRANFQFSVLAHCDFDNSDLSHADFRGANLNGTDLEDADLSGVNVETMFLNKGIQNHQVVRTDLSSSTLSQDGLNKMVGDSGTYIPEGLKRPSHWKLIDPTVPDVARYAEVPPYAGEDDYRYPDTRKPGPSNSHVQFIISNAEVAATTSFTVSQSIKIALEQSRLNDPASFENLLGVALAFDIVAEALRTSAAEPSRIAVLEAIIDHQRGEIERLTQLLRESPSSSKQILVAALGGAGATALVAASGYIFGPNSSDILSNIWDFIKGGGGIPQSPQEVPNLPIEV